MSDEQITFSFVFSVVRAFTRYYIDNTVSVLLKKIKKYILHEWLVANFQALIN